MDSPRTNLMPIGAPQDRGVKLAGTGLSVPETKLTNAALEKVMDTSDEWILKRTGISERRRINPGDGQSASTLGAAALSAAVADAGLTGDQLDMVICGTVSAEMVCPSTSCQIINAVGANGAAAVDVGAACCGFLYALNLAYAQVRSGQYQRVGVIGVDTLTETMEYTTRGRGTAILFGDGAGAAVLSACDDP